MYNDMMYYVMWSYSCRSFIYLTHLIHNIFELKESVLPFLYVHYHFHASNTKDPGETEYRRPWVDKPTERGLELWKPWAEIVMFKENRGLRRGLANT